MNNRNPSQSHVSQKWDSWGDNQGIPQKQKKGYKVPGPQGEEREERKRASTSHSLQRREEGPVELDCFPMHTSCRQDAHGKHQLPKWCFNFPTSHYYWKSQVKPCMLNSLDKSPEVTELRAVTWTTKMLIGQSWQNRTRSSLWDLGGNTGVELCNQGEPSEARAEQGRPGWHRRQSPCPWPHCPLPMGRTKHGRDQLLLPRARSSLTLLTCTLDWVRSPSLQTILA